MYEKFTFFARKNTLCILGVATATDWAANHRVDLAEYYPANKSEETGFYETCEGGIITRFYWECGLFPILMNDTSKCFRKKNLREIEYPAASSHATP